MDSSFYAYRMHYNGSGTPVLAKESGALLPESLISNKIKSDKIFLAGGFTAFTLLADVPLSPALQLNGDQGSLSPDALQRVGRAELNRLHAATFRSSILEPDNRVAVLARDESSLTQFLETYGSVLQLTPLLIDSYASGYNTADELEIEPQQNGCRIQYMVRKPVDLDKCTYCAACGPVCPEDCLNEHLFFDMSCCSYCNECVTTCPQQAIDLYRVEQYNLAFPALVLLDQPTVTMPDDCSHIYEPATLAKLFSSLAPLSIEETISWTSSCCQHSSRGNSGCTTCLDACRYNAIKHNQDGVSVDYRLCVECGACLASCPTGALQNLRFTDQQFIDWFNTVQPEAGSTVILGSEQELHRLWWKKNAAGIERVLFLEYPNVRGVTSMHLLFLLSLGADRVILLDDPQACTDKPVATQVEFANTVFKTLYGDTEPISIMPAAELTNLLPDSESSPLRKKYRDFSFSNRREKLASILSFLLDQDPNHQAPALTGRPFSAFGSVVCDAQLCTHCGACLNDCRIEALSTDSETFSLDHLAIRCVQCGICVDVCPENALTIKPGLVLAHSFFTPQELTRAEPINCLECGKPFGTQKSFDRIMSILNVQNPDMMEHNVLEYCETCRVVRLHEMHQ